MGNLLIIDDDQQGGSARSSKGERALSGALSVTRAEFPPSGILLPDLALLSRDCRSAWPGLGTFNILISNLTSLFFFSILPPLCRRGQRGYHPGRYIKHRHRRWSRIAFPFGEEESQLFP